MANGTVRGFSGSAGGPTGKSDEPNRSTASRAGVTEGLTVVVTDLDGLVVTVGVTVTEVDDVTVRLGVTDVVEVRDGVTVIRAVYVTVTVAETLGVMVAETVVEGVRDGETVVLTVVDGVGVVDGVKLGQRPLGSPVEPGKSARERKEDPTKGFTAINLSGG